MRKKVTRILSIFSILILLSFSVLIQESLAQAKKTFLWKVQSKTSTVYILGSIHYLKKEMYPLDEKIESAFGKSDNLVVEANINNTQKGDTQKFAESALYLDDDTFEKHVSPQTYDLVKKELERLGVSLELIGKQKPWFLALTLASLEIVKLGFDPNYGIESYFLSKAEGKKKILELENLDYQINLFCQLTEKEQELLLLYTLKDIKVVEQELDKLVKAWTSGDTKGVESIITRSLAEDNRLSPIYEKIIYERSRNMASRIEDYLKTEENYLVIVGAGHLVGKRGIIEILKGKGFLAEQM
jgi:uncharacterized protein YbaP (TraB family)